VPPLAGEAGLAVMAHLPTVEVDLPGPMVRTLRSLAEAGSSPLSLGLPALLVAVNSISNLKF